MTDAALHFDAEAGHFDLALDGVDLARDGGLQSAVIVSLFSDRLAGADDALPTSADDRRGWWADHYASDPIGSRLWLLSREKMLPAVAQAAEAYARESLKWLLDTGIAKNVDVSASLSPPNRLRLLVNIQATRLHDAGHAQASQRLIIADLDVDVVINDANIVQAALQNTPEN